MKVEQAMLDSLIFDGSNVEQVQQVTSMLPSSSVVSSRGNSSLPMNQSKNVENSR